ncbi:MAG TPA: iron ABC transporter permease [Candidatus Acidoferrales bacterium]|nr:iron ABC transporter permease [Candidatus Acidoferrales bacterium]
MALTYAETAVAQGILSGVGRRAARAGLVALGFFLLFWLIVLPLLMVVMVSFRSGTPLELGPFTFANYALTYTYPLTYQTLLNSLLYAGVSVAIVMAIAILFAWLVERTDMPFRRLAWALILLPIGMPSFLLTMSWILLLNPRVGVLNVPLRSLLGWLGIALETGPFNIYSLAGMIFVNSITGLTTVFLLVVGAFRLVNQEIEDAAHVCGARKRVTLFKVTLPVLMPALTVATLYKFAGDLNDMDIPLLLGLQKQIYVLPTLIFFSAFYSTPIEWGLATALSSPFILIAISLSYAFFHFIIKQAERQKYVTITGKASQTRRIQLGRWRYPAFGLFLLYFMLSTGLPLLILLWASLLPSYRPPSWQALSLISFAKYLDIMNWPNIGRILTNTLLLGTCTAMLAMAVAFFISWIVVRSRAPGRFFLDAAVFVPHVLPGSVVALGLVFTYLHPAFRWLPIYGSIWIMVAGLLVTYLPFSTRLMNGALTQIHKELEEAGMVSGARRLTVLLRITLPLILPPFVMGFIWVASHAFRSLTIPLMLSTPETETVSVLLFFLWDRNADFSGAAALGILLIVAVSILTLLSRRLVEEAFSGRQRS